MRYYDLLRAGAYGRSRFEPVSATDYARIASIVRSGRASDYFRIGDQIMSTYTDTNGNEYECPWDVVAFKEATTLESGITVPSMVLQMHYATVEEIQVDAPETDRPAEADYQGQIKQYGWNRYSMSAIRQWLNSDKAAGSWWTAQHEYDAAPTQASTVNGFMRGLNADFLAMIKPVKVETCRNYRDPDTAQTSGTYEYDTTYDTFYLPSKEEEYTAVNEPNHREGAAWQYWIDRLTLPAQEINESLPQQNHSSAEVTHAIKAHRRFILNSRSSADVVWLRSCNRGSSYFEWIVGSAGNVGSNAAYSSRRAAPACEIC